MAWYLASLESIDQFFSALRNFAKDSANIFDSLARESPGLVQMRLIGRGNVILLTWPVGYCPQGAVPAVLHSPASPVRNPFPCNYSNANHIWIPVIRWRAGRLRGYSSVHSWTTIHLNIMVWISWKALLWFSDISSAMVLKFLHLTGAHLF